MAMAAPAVASAQGGMGGGMGGGQQSPEQMLARQKERLFAGITLTDEQTKKVDSIMTAGMTKQREMMMSMRNGGGDMAGMRESMQKMNTERNDAIKAALTDEQKKKFDENLANMPQRRGGL
jgi:Spy/CpxP family protein refolding chaperone